FYVFSSFYFFFSSRRRHTIFSRDWSSDVCSSDLLADIVNVALDRADHHAAHLRRVGFCKQRAQQAHPALHRVGREQHLRDEKDRSEERRVGKEYRSLKTSNNKNLYIIYCIYLFD